MFRFLSYVWNRFKEYLILVVLVIVSLSLLTQNNNPQIQKVRVVAFGSFATVTSVFYDLFNITQLKNENKNLRKVNAELMIQLSMLREQGIINRELKGMLGYKDTSSLPITPATIVSRSLSLTQNTITIDAGTIKGIRPGMPVISYKGLVGIVQTCSDGFSIARTLKNVDLKLTVKNEKNRLNAIMKWDGEKLMMVDVPKAYDFDVGDRIVTSEMSSIIPIPIPVGIVSKIDEEQTGLLNLIEINPFEEVLTVEHVFIIMLIENDEKNNLELNFYNKK
ncbi:MAG: rod shape-determining protein MreC [Ignavibacteriaceae bacterium]|nr:rod shape-determining protein MreC [Ignavibacteriaceae bacterium]MCW8996887.1 rod shape-determining protein MreC [Psychromonas sp.]MCW9095396.1 rod shape-determining protein MreC [Ignavibacteriaceae bacterium]MCW9097504.1 rod shape-determining protein MreC [Ignavibacteriaceae bacterium]